MKIDKDPQIAILNDILSHISRKKMSAIKDGNHDMFDAYQDVFRFVVDIYGAKVVEWERKHPVSAMIMNIRQKRTLKRFRELTNEIRGTWV